MNLQEYAEFTLTTARWNRVVDDFSIAYLALGLVGEAGEVANKVKKFYRDDEEYLSPERRHEIAQELGDIMWYLTSLCNELGVSLTHIMELNVEKLTSRKERNVIKGDGDDR
jgi:NTP pyrophosphatase (non-canonical NTP hydrolase)